MRANARKEKAAPPSLGTERSEGRPVSLDLLLLPAAVWTADDDPVFAAGRRKSKSYRNALRALSEA